MKPALLFCTGVSLSGGCRKGDEFSPALPFAEYVEVAANGWDAHDRNHPAVSGETSGRGRGPRHGPPATK